MSRYRSVCDYEEATPLYSENNPPLKKLPVAAPYVSETFLAEGHTAFLILPDAARRTARLPMPWVWYAPTLPGLPGKEEGWMFERLLETGIAIAGIEVGESYGSPTGRALFSALYDELTIKRGMARKPALLARSRGGLMLYNWAAENPARVACIAGIYPVCNLQSYPGLAKASGAYGLTEKQLSERLTEHNPIERLAPLAAARVPILHIHGDRDTVVPLEENSATLARRYHERGGEITLKVMKGRAHDMWKGWFQSQELVDFLIRYCKTPL